MALWSPVHLKKVVTESASIISVEIRVSLRVKFCRLNVAMSPYAQSGHDTPSIGGQDLRHTASLPNTG